MTPQEAIQTMLDSGMTQQEIADKCNVTQPAISLLLSGARKEPSRRLWNELVRLGKLAKRRMNK